MASIFNDSTAFTIYGENGQPLVHIIPIEDGKTGEFREELNEKEADMCMKLFHGSSNGDSILRWKEVF